MIQLMTMKNLKVAIVDDEVDMLEIIQLFFKDEEVLKHYDFSFYLSAEECLQDIKSIDYLVSDINMPGMDGFQLVTEAKKLVPNLRVCLMSAHCGDEHQDRARGVGVEKYFVKPLDINLMKDYLGQALKKRQV